MPHLLTYFTILELTLLQLTVTYCMWQRTHGCFVSLSRFWNGSRHLPDWLLPEGHQRSASSALDGARVVERRHFWQPVGRLVSSEATLPQVSFWQHWQNHFTIHFIYLTDFYELTYTVFRRKKNTHSHFLSYLRDWCVDLNKNCSEYT